MADTYTQSYFHLIFTPKHREALIKAEWKDELEKYITAIIQNRKHKLLAIGTRPDHIHILIGYHLNDRIPDLIEEIKTSTSAWIKERRLSKFKFDWQKGYGAFTHSQSQVHTVINYIRNQDIHHKKRTFRDEYLDILLKNGVEFKQEYLFEFFDETDK